MFFFFSRVNCGKVKLEMLYILFQVSEFFQSQNLSTEQILQQYGSQGVVAGRGKRLEELTKRVQESQRPRHPQQQQRQPGQNVQAQYGNRMPQPGYMVKEEMGRQRRPSQEEHRRKSPYDGTNFEDSKSDGTPNAKQYQPGYNQQRGASPGKPHPQSSPSPTLRTSPQVAPVPEPISPSSSMGLDDITLPPGIPTHLPPPPLAVGMLDQMSLGGGYGAPDIGKLV